MSVHDWLYPASVLLTGYVVLGITGFGSALVTVPLLAWIWPLPEVVVLAILLDIPAAMLHGGLNFRQVNWPSVTGMLPGMLVGTAIGLGLAGLFDQRWPLFILGVYIMLVGLKAWRRRIHVQGSISPLMYHAGSSLVGVIEVMFATAGPMVLAILQRRLPDIAAIRATAPVTMVVVGSIAVAALLGSAGVDSTEVMYRWAYALPVALLGVVLGNRVARHLPVPLMARLIAVLLFTSGLSLTRHMWV